MDSAHEEPELPSAIQDLVQRLEGQGEPITELPDFVSWSEPLSTIIGWRSQVRLRVLEAIGSCNTLEILDVGKICGGYISRLTPSEWEVVFRGFRCSTVLKEIRVFDRVRGSDDAEVESLCLQLGRILNSSSVTELEVRGRLSARCLSNLASGLRGHSDSKLKSLDLWRAWKDSSGVKYVADMINSAPLLETLRLGGYWEDMEDETVGILSQAVIHSSSLKELTLDNADPWGGPLLLKALAGDDRNRSIERLRLTTMIGRGDFGDCLRELLISNRSLKEVEFQTRVMRPEELPKLGEAIRDNAIATTILVRVDRYDNWKLIEALARSASSDVKDPIVELELVSTTDVVNDVMLSLNLLGRVLRGEITSLKSLSILVPIVIRTSGTNQDRQASILSMNGKTGETCVLKRLRLFGLSIVCEDVWKGLWKDLLLCLRGNTSVTHLDLSCNELNEDAFRDMMGLLQVNLSLQEINVSKTSWATDGKAALIQEALKQNKMRAAYMSVFMEAKLKFGDAKAGRLFLCGSPRAALGQKFHAQEHESKSHSSYSSKDGFVSESVFVGLIEEFLGKQPHGQIGVDRDVIENILIHLDLCFKVEDTSQFYFIPSFIPEHASNEEQKPQEGKDLESMAWESRGETSQFVGIRIQCQDGRTMSLTAAFFPCFQMFMRRKLISEMRVSKKTVTCSRQYLRLFLDGHEIYVEQGTSHNYMDVLMLRSKHKSRSEALQYLMKHIVQVLISFCASSKGCPGVALVLSVIQTSCVEMLIPSHLRGAILIEELKSNFIDSINDKLEDIQLDRFHMEKEEALFSYEHSWPSIEGHTGIKFS
ncbi:hypothetical protein AXG93_4604s1090 [Marchantia polymorpha subsp. ruderalis]|uniref:Uncharacterized protein n=1 Tax=Marchantia polymorpha subsp. ruderalis TaxID=1480154 RepID=A0A176VXV1_MARPO|nr:hypothetical protein AXG93_4604s1090 [Marchantia polymorpha subsp. ruderalis]